jgi:hypothetical protein
MLNAVLCYLPRRYDVPRRAPILRGCFLYTDYTPLKGLCGLLPATKALAMSA